MHVTEHILNDNISTDFWGSTGQAVVMFSAFS